MTYEQDRAAKASEVPPSALVDAIEEMIRMRDPQPAAPKLPQMKYVDGTRLSRLRHVMMCISEGRDRDSLGPYMRPSGDLADALMGFCGDLRYVISAAEHCEQLMQEQYERAILKPMPAFQVKDVL